MKLSKYSRQLVLAAFVAAVLVGIAGTALAADPPVVVTVTVTGDPVPGATVTAKAAVKINDGSTLNSIKWTQAGGVPVTFTGGSSDTITVPLPARKVFREHLIEILEEAPAPEDALPAYVPPPDPYEAGLQNRFGVVAIAPLAMEHAGAVTFDIEVKTSSGTYAATGAVHANLPWPTATGVRNVGIQTPVIVHGKTQASYDWKLTKPAGSAATLADATSQNPEFTPDVAGTYTLTVTDIAAAKQVSLDVHAGTWRGMITGQTAQGLPVSDPECIKCHVRNTPHFDLFTPWEKTGHAEVFKQNVNTLANHYGPDCLSCHTVGYDKKANNGGIDDSPEYAAFLAAGLMTPGALDNYDKILAQFPNVAKLGNIQCENCHGPNDSAAHMRKDMSRKTQSSDLCGTCHGEPARHGRYQQWQLSRHGNYELAREEGTDPTCSKCHSSQGFIDWADGGFADAALKVDWTTDDVHPVTCAACHDPHAIGTTSGGPTTNATVRISGATPNLMAGFKATGVGRGAICMTCHNGRRGLRDDAHFVTSDLSRAPHVGPQADILMGQNLFFAEVGVRGNHAAIEDSCVTCHMESTPPPPTLSYNSGGTNHTFYAKPEICAKCHTAITLASVQGPVEEKMEELKGAIELAIRNLMQTQIRMGNAIDLGGVKTVKNANDIKSVEFIESHGRQGVTVTLMDNSKAADLALNAVKVVRPAGSPVELYALADPALPKAGWNYFMIESDKSKGAHNPAFVNQGLDVSLFAVQAVNKASALAGSSSGRATAAVGGGLGDGKGAVSCKTPYVYWSEIASHNAGVGTSLWRTDLVARNLATSTATVKFVLHQGAGNLEGNATIDGNSQKAFEDLVATLGGTNNIGSLEICSDEPLLVLSRVFNQSADGTFGQSLDGHVADLGYAAGETFSLIGMRQKSGAYRTNLFVTNSGSGEAQVSVTLYDATGKSLNTFALTIPAGQVLQEGEPFKNRANAPDVDWGFATITVTKGANVHAVASMIDMKTNDPTTIPAKQ